MLHLRRLARQALLASVLLVMIGGALAIPAAQVARAWDAGVFSASDESLLFSLTNQARAASGLAPLRNDSQLHALAEWRAQDMSVRDYFSHQIPPQGYEVFHYMDLKGIQYVLAGENIGWVSTIADNAATAWIQQQFMSSPEHRANILGAAWDSMGVGAYKGADGKFMYCVLFKESKVTATPKPAATPRAVAAPRPAATPKPAPLASRPPTPAPTVTPAATLTPSPSPGPTATSTPPDLVPADTMNPATPPAGPAAKPTTTPSPLPAGVISQRVVDAAPPPGLLESLMSAMFGVPGSI